MKISNIKAILTSDNMIHLTIMNEDTKINTYCMININDVMGIIDSIMKILRSNEPFVTISQDIIPNDSNDGLDEANTTGGDITLHHGKSIDGLCADISIGCINLENRDGDKIIPMIQYELSPDDISKIENFIVPYESVRDDAGRIIGCKSLGRI